MSLEVLQELFRCERYTAGFPCGLTVRACLRRQLERQKSAEPGKLGPPTRPHCASGACEMGRVNIQRAAAAGVGFASCPKCGGAIFGADCEGCASLEDPKAVPSGVLAGQADRSVRIWNGEAPDMPIGPPSPHQGERLSTPDLGTLAPTRRAPIPARNIPGNIPAAVDQEPAQPAEETTMACNECGSPTCHKATCSKRPGAKPAASTLPAKPKAAPAKKAAAPPRKAMTDKGGVTVMAVRALDTPSLILVRETVERELQERLATAENELKRLREAVQAAAARAA